MYFVVPFLGAVLVFVINPTKIRLLWRILCLLACSVWVAPFVIVPMLIRGETNVDVRSTLVRAFLVGPLLVLWLAGLSAIGMFVRGGYAWLRERWTGRGRAVG